VFTLAHCILLSAFLVAIGAYGVLARRNLLVVLMSVEIMLNGANVALVAFSRYYAGGGAPLAGQARPVASGGQAFVLMSMAVAACEVAVGLALLIALFRTKQTVMSDEVAELKG
jgi:NADH-quinone oxidoreductase subunit K